MKEVLNRSDNKVYNGGSYNTRENSPKWLAVSTETLIRRSEIISSRIIRRLTGAGKGGPLALTDARKVKIPDENEKSGFKVVGVGMQAAYLGVLPDIVDARMVWVAQDVKTKRKRKKARSALKATLEATKDRNKVVLVTGGEHFDKTTIGYHGAGTDEEGVRKHGGFDKQRDIATLSLIRYAIENDLPLIAICRGMQGALYYGSDGRAIPKDHGQKEHSFPPETLEHKIFNRHDVENVLSKWYKGPPLDLEIPVVERVNSVHEQGYKVKDISKEVMMQLNARGFYPWLVAKVPGIPEEEQVYEGWLHIRNGKIKGVLTQFHPEQQFFDGPGHDIRMFMQKIGGARLDEAYSR